MRATCYKTILLGINLTVLAAACQAAPQQSASADTSANAPVETRKPNSDYKPAVPGQTRAPGVKTKTAIQATVINSELKQPWGLCVLPDGRFLVTEKGGTMRILKADGTADKKITNLPAVVAQGQGGLLDVNIDPAFTTNHIIYWDYAESTADGNILAIAKGKLTADESKVDDIQVIYRAKPAYRGALQYGSRILFDKHGDLFVSTGERSGGDIRMKAQDLD
ncbi:MAG TPA: PQQ-dependent sugar dehydrogenase, partial [Mucilaginibacter sp.]